MTPSSNAHGTPALHQWVVVRPEGAGWFTAQVVGLPEVRASAGSREQAVEQVRTVLQQWLANGQLTPVAVHSGRSLADWPGHDPAEPLEQEFGRSRALPAG